MSTAPRPCSHDAIHSRVSAARTTHTFFSLRFTRTLARPMGRQTRDRVRLFRRKRCPVFGWDPRFLTPEKRRPTGLKPYSGFGVPTADASGRFRPFVGFGTVRGPIQHLPNGPLNGRKTRIDARDRKNLPPVIPPVGLVTTKRKTFRGFTGQGETFCTVTGDRSSNHFASVFERSDPTPPNSADGKTYWRRPTHPSRSISNG